MGLEEEEIEEEKEDEKVEKKKRKNKKKETAMKQVNKYEWRKRKHSIYKSLLTIKRTRTRIKSIPCIPFHTHFPDGR